LDLISTDNLRNVLPFQLPAAILSFFGPQVRLVLSYISGRAKGKEDVKREKKGMEGEMNFEGKIKIQ
jgi:hypothetical protein